MKVIDLDVPVIPALVSAAEGSSWQDDALCAQTDPELFFPEKGGTTAPAKRVCRACPVRPECLEWALDADERFGVLGGLSPRERRRLRGLADDDLDDEPDDDGEEAAA
jgi:WhiB family redox-sensing transcriptional regulator